MRTNKKVLSIIGLDPVKISAAEIWFRELSRQLGRNGFESVLCYLNAPPERVREFLQLPNVTLEVMKNSERLGWNQIRDLRRLLKKYRPQIVHCHYTGGVSPYPWLAKLYSTKKIFFTDQTSRPEGYVIRQAPFGKRMLRRMINSPLTGVQCVSQYGRACNVAEGVLPRRRYQLIYNAVDIDRAISGIPAGPAFRKRYAIPEQKHIVAQVSWIIPEKGIQDLLQAARLIMAQRSDVHLVIVGDGPYRGECERFAQEIGIAEHVTWTGVVQDPLSEGVYAAADVVCQMSRWEEVFGQVITEAMATGKPVVGTRVGGIPELIADGETGCLVDRGDTAAMAHTILRLLNDSAERMRMGLRGRQAVEKTFSHRKNVRQLLALYGLSTPEAAVQEDQHSLEQDSATVSITS